MNFKRLPETLADDITKIKAAYGIRNEWCPLTLGGLHNVVLSVTAHKMKWFDKKRHIKGAENGQIARHATLYYKRIDKA